MLNSLISECKKNRYPENFSHGDFDLQLHIKYGFFRVILELSVTWTTAVVTKTIAVSPECLVERSRQNAVSDISNKLQAAGIVYWLDTHPATGRLNI